MPGQILLIGAIRGLASEGQRINLEFQRFGPDTVALAISKEGLEAMGQHGLDESGVPGAVNTEEELYVEGLSKYGDVIKPPPCFSEPMRMANDAGIIIKTLDMDDEHFTTAYCKYVSALDMVRQGRCEKKWARHKFTAKNPVEFVLEWDRVVNWLPGYQKLETAREEWIAKGICTLSKHDRNTLVVVELERLRGIMGFLDRMGCDYNASWPNGYAESRKQTKQSG